MVVKKLFTFILVVVCTAFSMRAMCQERHFVYLQSDNGQPFYVRLNGKLFSSTASGYVILPKLDNGSLQINIGFPKNEYPEEAYNLTISGDNEGYLLKYLDHSWSLLNIESLALIAGANSAQQPIVADTERTVANDAFSNMLADVVKDSSILKENVLVQTAAPVAVLPKADTQSAAIIPEIADTAALLYHTDSVKNTDTAVVNKVGDETTAPKVVNPFLRILMVNEQGGQDMVYVNKATRDTIRLFVPFSPANIVKRDSQPKARVIYEAPKTNASPDLTITPTIVTAPEQPSQNSQEVNKKADQKTAQIIYDEKEQEKAGMPEGNVQTKSGETTAVNANCNAVADSKDFLKLQKKMIGQSNNQKMLEVARRSFKAKCYTTDQVRNLSYLFLKDEEKYQFFDAAYPYIADSDQFYTLESQLKDPYFVNRFKAMIHK